MRSAELAEETGLGHDRIIISAKVSQVRDLVDVYRLLAARSDYPLHLGLTEAGLGDKGIVASTAGLAILLNEGIGDTIRVSLTPEPGRRPRARGRDRPAGPPVDGDPLVPAAGRACPGCGRTTSTFFQEMAQQIQTYLKDRMPEWKRDAPRRRGDAGRGHGLRRERPGRVEARRHRDLAAGHVRGAGRARCSSTASSTGRSGARASSTSSSASSRSTSPGGTRRADVRAPGPVPAPPSESRWASRALGPPVGPTGEREPNRAVRTRPLLGPPSDQVQARGSRTLPV